MDKPTRQSRFHGRVYGSARTCSANGCTEPGEFRAPAAPGIAPDCPPQWRWLCLDHVREFNARYNFFAGMSVEEITAAQTPYAGWSRETRAFASNATSPPPKWADFDDPLDALGAGFADSIRRRAAERAEARATPRDRALKVLGLDTAASPQAIRRAYAALVRRYHPDRNGGDRSHEKALQAVVAAYSELRNLQTRSR